MSSTMTHGFAQSYTKNSDGTFSVNVISGLGIIKSNATSGSTIQTSTVNNSTITTPSGSGISSTINCIGILNSNNLVSTKSPYQAIIISNDNKYIFLPIPPNSDPGSIKVIDSYIMSYYFIAYSVINYNGNVPDITYINILLNEASSPNLSKSALNLVSNDQDYNNITDPKIKSYYLACSIGLEPYSGLSTQYTDLKKYKDAAIYFYTQYEYFSAINNSITNSNVGVVKGNDIIPDEMCIDTDTSYSNSINSIIRAYDCRNITDGSPKINPNDDSNPQLNSPSRKPNRFTPSQTQTAASLGGSSMMSVICSCIMCIGGLLLILYLVYSVGSGSSTGKISSNKKRR